MRIAHNKNKTLEEYYGKERAKEIRENIRLAQIKKWNNPKYRENMSKSHLGNKSHLGFSKYANKEEKEKAHKLQGKIAFKKYSKKYPEKIIAHSIANNNIEIPENQLCEICNENLATQKHHEDYSNPLEVNFLCIECHIKIHNGEQFEFVR